MGKGSKANTQLVVNEAQDLANILKAGKLDAPARIVQDQVVGPTLGEDAVRGGILSFSISFGVIFLLMLIYYNTAGIVANIALILNLLFTIGVLSAWLILVSSLTCGRLFPVRRFVNFGPSNPTAAANAFWL